MLIPDARRDASEGNALR